MNSHLPPPSPDEPLTPEERAWAQRLARIGPHDGPPPALDTRILAAAHAAVAPRAARRAPPTWRRRWPTLVGAAASLVIVAGLAWQLRPLLRSTPSLGEGPPAAAIPRSEGTLSEDVLAAADPVAKVAVDSPPPPAAPSVARAPRKPVLPPPAPTTPATTAAPSPRTPGAFGDDAIPPYADYAGTAEARQAAAQAATAGDAARAANDEHRERAADASPQPFPAERGQAADMAAAPPIPPPPPSSTAPAESAARRDFSSPPAARKSAVPSAATAAGAAASASTGQDNTTLDRVEVTGSRIAMADLPVRDDTGLEPAEWLQRIRDRRDGGDLDGARASLALFRDAHPRIRLPDDLARLPR